MALIEVKIIVSYFLKLFDVKPNLSCCFAMNSKLTYTPSDPYLVVLTKKVNKFN